MKGGMHFDIPRRHHTCIEGGETFSPEMEYYSVLFDDSKEGFLRKDFCLSCWQEAVKGGKTKSEVIHWKSRVPAKIIEEDPYKSRNEKALELLKKNLEERSLENEAEAFVLALLLTRKKILYFRQELPTEGGDIVNLYEISETEEMLSVKRVQLSDIKTATIQQTLAQKLQ